MNKTIFKGKWNQLKGSVKKRWGRLTDDDLDVIEGDSQRLSGKLQEKYGKSKEEADQEVREFEREQE